MTNVRDELLTAASLYMADKDEKAAPPGTEAHVALTDVYRGSLIGALDALEHVGARVIWPLTNKPQWFSEKVFIERNYGQVWENEKRVFQDVRSEF